MLPATEDTGRLHPRWTLPPLHNYSLGMERMPAPTGEPGVFSLRRPEPAQNKDVSSRFGRRLRELRLERQLTQTDMAKRFGIDRSFISDVERGRKSISLPMLEVIAIGLNVSLSQLFLDL